MDWPAPIPVHTKSKSSIGKAGSIRKLGLETTLIGFVSMWVKHGLTSQTKLGLKYEGWERDQALRTLFFNTAKHVPVDVYFKEITASFGRDLFDISVEVMENYRKTEERYAPSGWQMASFYHQYKQFGTGRGESDDEITSHLKKLKWASSSDYNINKNPRSFMDGIRLYKRLSDVHFIISS